MYLSWCIINLHYKIEDWLKLTLGQKAFLIETVNAHLKAEKKQADKLNQRR